jgi:hypothetical protein
MPTQTPDDLEGDDEMKAKLEHALGAAHTEDGSTNDLFATDALGNAPAKNASGGEEQENSDSDFSSESE